MADDHCRWEVGRLSKIITIANQKGGVGKTTTAINLAACLAVMERPTLLVDTDPQSNATSGLGINPEKGKTTYEVLLDGLNISEAIVPTQVPQLFAVPSDMHLVGAEIEMVETEGRERAMSRALASLSEQYEYVIIDCPPSLGLLTVNALTAAHSVLIPVQCEYFALEGLGQLINTITMIKNSLNPELVIEGVVLTMYDSRLRLSNQIVDEVKRYFGTKVFNTIVSRNVRLTEAPSFGKPIILYDALSTGTKNYMALAHEVLKRITLIERRNFSYAKT